MHHNNAFPIRFMPVDKGILDMFAAVPILYLFLSANISPVSFALRQRFLTLFYLSTPFGHA